MNTTISSSRIKSMDPAHQTKKTSVGGGVSFPNMNYMKDYKDINWTNIAKVQKVDYTSPALQ